MSNNDSNGSISTIPPPIKHRKHKKFKQKKKPEMIQRMKGRIQKGEAIKVTLLLEEEEDNSETDDNSEASQRHKFILKNRCWGTEMMGKVMQRVQSDDTSQLKKVIASYVTPYLDKKGLNPPLAPNKCCRWTGFNHPELACLLCPVKHLPLFLDDPKEMQKKLQDECVTATAANWPVLWFHHVSFPLLTLPLFP
ncbi:hypothetical protein V8B97DRAFT_1913355 [Scleroderma yunnanense]